MMQLNFKKSGTGHPLIILHGLLGSLDNWQTIANKLQNGFIVYLLDQRNHGKSLHTQEHSYKLMAEDLMEFYQQQNILSAHVLGHSMGGKTAMQFALNYPEKVNKLIVVDMGIKNYPPKQREIFDALFSIELSKIRYRADAEKILLEKINDFTTRQFILKNLSRNTNRTYQWKFNLQSLHKNYESEINALVTGNSPFTGKVMFIRGEKSDYILNDDWLEIQNLFPNSKLTTVKDAGHWVHADKPAELSNIILNFLNGDANTQLK
jgi:pimeloyl-ACP methyl ester carboxylesterase